MPPKDTCPSPDLRDSAQDVVDALVENKSPREAYQLVSDFWKEHHSDEEWDLFRDQMHIDEAMLTLGKDKNDPLVQMFNNFEIVLDLKYDLDPPSFQPGGIEPGPGYPPGGKGDPPGHTFNPDGHPPYGGSEGTQRNGTPPTTNQDSGGKDKSEVFHPGPF